MLVGSYRCAVCLSFDDESMSEILPNWGKHLGSGSYGVYGFAYLDSTDKFLVVCFSTSHNERDDYVTHTEVWSSKTQRWSRTLDFPFGIVPESL